MRNALAAAALAILAAAAPAAAITFDVTFDATADNRVSPPFVGSGSFSFDDLGNGTFALAALTDVVADFTVGSETFSLADAVTPLANVQVRVVEVSGERSLTFGGSGGGLFNGSFDFLNGNGLGLSFQPNFGPLYFVNDTTTSDFGTFRAVAAPVPLPLTLPLLAAALGALAAAARGRRVA